MGNSLGPSLSLCLHVQGSSPRFVISILLPFGFVGLLFTLLLPTSPTILSESSEMEDFPEILTTAFLTFTPLPGGLSVHTSVGVTATYPTPAQPLSQSQAPAPTCRTCPLSGSTQTHAVPVSLISTR